MNWKNNSWSICQKIPKGQDISYDDIHELIRDLSFKVLFELEEPKLQDRVRLQVFANGTSRNDLARTRPNSWIVYREYAMAVDHLQNFVATKDEEELEQARRFALKAVSSDPYYEQPLYLLLRVGIAYLNMGKENNAERLSRYIVSIRSDSFSAWYSWGLALHMMKLDEEAIECFNEILKPNIIENRDLDIYIHANVMKAVSLRRLKRLDEALYYFKKSLYMDKSNGFAWGHYGLTLEAKLDEQAHNESASQRFSEERNEVLLAYLKAIKYFPEFVSVRSALARIYLERGLNTTDDDKRDFYKREAKLQCEKAREYRKKIEVLSDYNRACFLITCGSEDLARKYLENAVKNKNVPPPKWLKADPDWKAAKEQEWFKNLLEGLKKSDNNNSEKIDIITKTAIKTMINREIEKDSLLFYETDIEDLEGLVNILKKSEDALSKYLMEKYGKELSAALVQEAPLELEIGSKNLLDYLNSAREKMRTHLSKRTYETLIKTNFHRRKQPLLNKLAENAADPMRRHMKRSRLMCCLLKLLNDSLKDPDLFDPDRFKHVKLQEEIKSQAIYNINKPDLPILLFSWTKIPGTDDERLKEFLKKRYHIDWVYTAGFVKSEDGKTINISKEDITLSLTLNDEESDVILKIDNIETDKFIAKKENGELKIYLIINRKLLNRKLLNAAYNEKINGNLTEPELREHLRKCVHKENAYNRARIYALDGKPREALMALSIALHFKYIIPDDARFEPDFESIRREPDFQDLLKSGFSEKRTHLSDASTFLE